MRNWKGRHKHNPCEICSLTCQVVNLTEHGIVTMYCVFIHFLILLVINNVENHATSPQLHALSDYTNQSTWMLISIFYVL